MLSARRHVFAAPIMFVDLMKLVSTAPSALRRFPRAALRALAVGVVAFAGVEVASAQSRAQLDQRLRGAEQAIVDQEDRLVVLERDRLTGDPVAVRLIERLDALEAQTAAVTGALERLALENQQLRSRVATLIREIELRDKQIAAAANLPPAVYGPFDVQSPVFSLNANTDASAQSGAALPAGGPATIAGSSGALGFETAADAPSPAVAAPARDATAAEVTLPGDPDAALQLAKDLVIRGRYDEAAGALSVFVERFPTSDHIGEAWFWRGEVDFVRSVYDAAAKSYISSLDVDPTGPKAPEAMIRLASALNALGVAEEACTTLDDFDRQYRRAPQNVKAKAQRVRESANCP